LIFFICGKIRDSLAYLGDKIPNFTKPGWWKFNNVHYKQMRAPEK